MQMFTKYISTYKSYFGANTVLLVEHSGCDKIQLGMAQYECYESTGARIN